jgi:hypothetical protein
MQEATSQSTDADDDTATNLPLTQNPNNATPSHRLACISVLFTILAYIAVYVGARAGLASSFNSMTILPSSKLDFNATLAVERLKLLSDGSHPLYSKQHKLVQQRILEMMGDIQRGTRHNLLVDVMENSDLVASAWGVHLLYPGQIVVKLSSNASSSNALLLSAHYDSQVDSYGANDDGTGVVTILELLRVFSLRDSLPYTLILNINANEEMGLLGSYALATHPFWNDVRAVINVEAGGAGGRAMLFQANDAGLLQAYSEAATYPHMSVLFNEVMGLGVFPSDTDYSIYTKVFGLPGLDFAFYEGRGVYHTTWDNVDHVNAHSLAHLGDGLLHTIDQIFNKKLLDRNPSPLFTQSTDEWRRLSSPKNTFTLPRMPMKRDAIFFDVAGGTWSVWPTWLAHTLFVLMACALLFMIIHATMVQDVERRSVFLVLVGWYILFALLSWVAASLLLFLMFFIFTVVKDGVFGAQPWLMVFFANIFTVRISTIGQSLWEKRLNQKKEGLEVGSLRLASKVASWVILLLFLLIPTLGGTSVLSLLYPFYWCALPSVVLYFLVWVIGSVPILDKMATLVRTRMNSIDAISWMTKSDFVVVLILNIYPSLLILDLSLVVSQALGIFTSLNKYLVIFLCLLVFLNTVCFPPYLVGLREEKHFQTRRMLLLILAMIAIPLCTVSFIPPNVNYFYPFLVRYKQETTFSNLTAMTSTSNVPFKSLVSLVAPEHRDEPIKADMETWLKEYVQKLPNTTVSFDSLGITLEGNETNLPFYFKSIQPLTNASTKSASFEFTMNVPQVCQFTTLNAHNQLQLSSLELSSQNPVVVPSNELNFWYAVRDAPMTVHFSLSAVFSNPVSTPLKVECSIQDDSLMSIRNTLVKQFNSKAALCYTSYKLHAQTIVSVG